MTTNALFAYNCKQKDLLKSTPLRSAAIMYWAISSVIKRPKTALICGDKQSMVSQFAEQSGFDTINVLPKLLLQRYGFWIYDRAMTLGYEPTILANVSRDIKLATKVMAGFNNLGKDPLLIKQRTIDEQYIGLHKLDWLHIEDTSPDLLIEGGTTLLCRDKPIITLNNALDLDTSKAVMSILKQYGYQCFNHLLESIDLDNKEGNDFTSAWVCIHEDDVALQAIINITGFNNELVINSYLGSKVDIVKGYYDSLIVYKTLGQHVLSSYLMSDYRIVDIDALLVESFYGQEHDNDAKWNWSGPSSESKILLPIEASGQYHIKASIYSLPQQVQSLPCYVFVDGKLSASDEIKSGEDIAFDFTVTQNSDSPSVEVLFCIPNTVNIDGKYLGFSIDKIELYFKENELR